MQYMLLIYEDDAERVAKMDERMPNCAAYVEATAFDRRGDEVELELEGMPARVLQHEVDHLDGVLFIDKVDLATLHWMNPELPAE